MTDCPRTVTVGPYRYAVSTDAKDIANERRDTGHAGRIASADHAKSTMTIDAACSPDVRREALLHEVLHACWFVAGNRAGKLPQEEAIELLTPTLLDALRRNPDLVTYLLTQEPQEP